MKFYQEYHWGQTRLPIVPHMFGIYIDELESLHEHIHDKDGCLLHHVLISILLFADDVILLASSLEGMYKQLDALEIFCDLHHFMINLGKTKVTIFNRSKKIHFDFLCFSR
jgi:hypothetical protein